MIVHCVGSKFVPKGSMGVSCRFGYAGLIHILRPHPTHSHAIVTEIIQIFYPSGTPSPPWDYIVPGRTSRQFEARCDEYRAILQSWIDDCDATHGKCSLVAAKLPRRVLDVSGDTGHSIRLHVSSPGDDTRYIALSHCWGKTPLPRTTEANLRQQREGIPVDKLPKSFQDAVAVTRSIGVRYLWIDSLCIVQDSIADWETESSQMAAIYNNAYVVLSASQATDSSCGFLDRVDRYDVDDLSASWRNSAMAAEKSTEFGRIKNPDSSISRVFARPFRGNYTRRHHEVLEESPLSSRAWGLQERLLARRVVHFTKSELLWECVECLKCECMEMDNTKTDDSSPSGLVRGTQFTNLHHKAHTDRARLWIGLLSLYSQLMLTYESDRLAALSGLARHWQARGASQYLAGFWRDDILESLMWSVPGFCQRSSEYRAPSWSPFSLDYESGSEASLKRQHGVHFEHHDVHGRNIKRSYATVVDASCEPAGIDVMGSVKSGFLLLKGRVLRCPNNFRGVPKSDSGEKSQFGHIWVNGCQIQVDWDIWVLGLEELTLILIGSRGEPDTSEPYSPSALVLVASKKERNSFERVGRASAPIGTGTRVVRAFPMEEEEVKIV